MFIHGGNLGSHYEAWNYIVANAPKELVGDFLTSYKRGKYIQEVFEKATKEHQAIACKYQNFLSQRKFNLVCKTQSSYFNAELEVWVSRNVKCVGLDFRVPQLASHAAVEKFVNELNSQNGQSNPKYSWSIKDSHWTCVHDLRFTCESAISH